MVTLGSNCFLSGISRIILKGLVPFMHSIFVQFVCTICMCHWELCTSVLSDDASNSKDNKCWSKILAHKINLENSSRWKHWAGLCWQRRGKRSWRRYWRWVPPTFTTYTAPSFLHTSSTSSSSTWYPCLLVSFPPLTLQLLGPYFPDWWWGYLPNKWETPSVTAPCHHEFSSLDYKAMGTKANTLPRNAILWNSELHM